MEKWLVRGFSKYDWSEIFPPVVIEHNLSRSCDWSKAIPSIVIDQNFFGHL